MKWIKRVWNYLFGSKEVVKEEEEEEQSVTLYLRDILSGKVTSMYPDNNNGKEDVMDKATYKKVDGQEVTKGPVVAEVTATEFKKALKAKEERPEPPKKRHMNREMRLFLKSMGWGKVPPRDTTAQLWSAFEGLRKAEMRKNVKRAAFKRSFGK